MQLYIQKTANTPFIKFQEGVLIITGRSIPENAILFFEPLFKYVAAYSQRPLPLTEVNIFLEYANSSTNRSLMTVFTLLESIFDNGGKIVVNWYYEPDDELMLELGTDYKTILNIPFNIEEKEIEL